MATTTLAENHSTLSSWRDLAACKGKTDVFFPADNNWEETSEMDAKAICWTCPVREECLSTELADTHRRYVSGEPCAVTLGTVGGATRWERDQMLAADEGWWDEVSELAKVCTPEEADALRKMWEAVTPPADELADTHETDAGRRWGVSPSVMTRWLTEAGIKKTRPPLTWRTELDESILSVLSDGAPMERDAIVNAVEEKLPLDDVARCLTSRKRITQNDISENSAKRHLINLALYDLGQTRKGRIITYRAASGKQMVRIAA